MTATGHAIIGTVIAAKIGNPYVAVPIAIGSHILADLFPHWDAGTHGRNKKSNQLIFEAMIDVILGFIISYILIQLLFPKTDLIYAFIIIIAAQLLDWLTAPYYMFNMKFPPFTWIHTISSKTNTKLDKPWGIIGQAAILGVLVIMAKIF